MITTLRHIQSVEALMQRVGPRTLKSPPPGQPATKQEVEIQDQPDGEASSTK